MSIETPKPEIPIEAVISQDGRYSPAAFAFLREGLSKAVKDVHGQVEKPGVQRHVSGQQLCQALRDLAIERWGLLARTVLARWNVHATLDFGQMVYLLIEHNYMRKTDEDSLEDFRDVFRFEQAFCGSYEFELKE